MKNNLSPHLHRWRVMESLASLALFLLRLLAFGIPLLCLYAVADALLSLPPATRQTWNLLLPILLAAACAQGLRLPGPLASLALRLDCFANDRRRTLSCALDLERESDASPLHAEMRRSALADAVTQLHSLPLRAVIPVPALALAAGIALLGAAGAFALARAFPDAAHTVLARLRDPSADIAPWTRLRFIVSPETPRVLYGQDLPVTVRIEGGTLRHPLLLRTRIAGVEREAPCFREDETRFSQRLEQVTEPLEFSFSTGRIRSEWTRVDVEWLPQVRSARIRLEPPAYSGRPTRSIAFGERPLEGLPGTRAELRLTSNRPLSGGKLTLLRDGRPDEVLPAQLDANGEAVFTWTFENSAAISVTVADTLGHSLAQPLRGLQRVIPDAAPEVSLSEPPPFMLATPSIRIPLRGAATDDIGITRLTLVRGMPGFVDRPRLLDAGPSQRRRDFEDHLDLAALGVVPGQVIEIYLEAQDLRPDGGRSGVSPLSRIQIISDEEYAHNLRLAEHLEGFRERFHAATQAMQQASEALDELRKTVDGDPELPTLAAALEKAADAQRAAAADFEKLAEDFPIYDIESDAQQRLTDLRDHFNAQADALSAIDPNDMALAEKVAALAGANQEKMENAQGNLAASEAFLRLGEMLEQTTEFQRIVERQQTLVRILERYAYALPAEGRAALRRLGEIQTGIRDELEAWMAKTRERADALPSEFVELGEQAKAVVEAIERAEVIKLMEGAATSAANEDNRESLRLARAALDALRKAVEEETEGNDFAQMCQGNQPGNMPGQGSGLGQSLQQLLEALRNRPFPGSGRKPGGSGGGIGGFSDDGFFTQGSSPLHMPMRGPNRGGSELPRGQEVDGVSRGGSGGGSRQGPRSDGAPGGRSAAPSAPVELILEQAPPNYRDAIRGFYAIPRENTP
jgi:hypothetical protein